MFTSADSMLPLLMVNLAFAVVALAVGFVAGGWILGRRQCEVPKKSGAGDGDEKRPSQQEFERAEMATLRLRDLAHGVACDVDEHSDMVARITADLQRLDPNNVAETGEGVFRALEQIVTANTQLQDRLAQAEQQIAAQAAEIRAHETEARTDSLTNLNNRRAFDDELNRRHAEWQRRQTPYSLVILDIDHFKRFNDTHGHPAGDEVLRCVGRVLKQACRDMDLPCRYGGEEFAVVLPTTVAADGKNLVERVRKMIESMSVQFESRALRVTASVGLAEVNSLDDPSRVIKRADEALYASKAAGRNCSHLHNGKQCVPLSQTQPQPPAIESASSGLIDRLPNRTQFVDELRRRVAESSRTQFPLSVALLAVDDFSSLKHKLSPVGQTRVLDSVAEFVVEALREMDLIARVEESRLAILMPGNALIDSQLVIDRLLRGLDGSELPVGNHQVRLAINAVVVENAPDDTAVSLLQRAEKKLSSLAAAGVLAH